MNYYTILECDEHASLETIKAHYKRLVLKYHPDKNNGDSAKFIEVNTAYKSLLHKTAVVETLHERAHKYMWMLYLLMKPKNINFVISVSIQDVYNGVIKKINYKRYKNGVKEKHHVYIDLYNYQESYVLEECGDENHITKKLGDLCVTFKIDYEQFSGNLYLNNILHRYDISYTIDITLYEYFYGLKNAYAYISGSLDLSHHTPCTDGMIMIVPNKGLPYENDTGEQLRGNLTLLLHIRYDDVKKDERFKEFLLTYFS